MLEEIRKENLLLLVNLTGEALLSGLKELQVKERERERKKERERGGGEREKRGRKGEREGESTPHMMRPYHPSLFP